MSEEKRKMSAFEAFKTTQITFAEAEEKAKQEAGAPRIERFRIGEDGEYQIRILPLAPNFDPEGNILPMERKGYEYPVRQLFLAITPPSKKGGKSKKINIPVIRATDSGVGHSVDIIDTYVKIAREMYADDKELLDMIGGNAFGGGLRWNYQHAMMVLDLSSPKERAKGPKMWQCSHSQYKDIDAAKMRLWNELRLDCEQETCPISGFTDAYPVKIIRGNNGGKTEYKVEIGRKKLDIEESEAEKLLDLPRIPETIYRYTRYQFEATLEFLKQYDQAHEMKICSQPDFIEAVEKLKGELSPDDTSHFDLAGASSKGSEKEEVTISSLWTEYDAIVDQDLGEKSDEYQDLREKIRQFIEDKGLDIRISRSKNNQRLLEEIDEVIDEADKTPSRTETVEEDKPVARRAPKPKIEEPDQDESAGSEPDEEEVSEPETAPVTRRRARPVDEPDEDDEPEQPKDEEPVQTETPRRRLHNRRLR